MRQIENRKHLHTRGFTLVELLVVIAIIGILASIVVPNVTRWIRKARVTEALAEIKNLDTAMRGMLTDASVSDFRDIFTTNARAAIDSDAVFSTDVTAFTVTGTANVEANAQELYNTIFYELVRQGRDADMCKIRAILVEIATQQMPTPLVLTPDGTQWTIIAPTCTADGDPIIRPEILSKFGSSYMPLENDPWGNLYNFWLDPKDPNDADKVKLRSYRVTDLDAEPYVAYKWDPATRALAVADLPGQPDDDDLPGFPAPTDLPIYIWSRGPNKVSDAHLEQQKSSYGVDLVNLIIADGEFTDLAGGGDDINNWDTEAGWDSAPTE